jgi:RNA polymerase primary sigma factor
VWWIRQSILQALAEQARIVRLPLNRVSSLNKMNSTLSDLEQRYQREPTNEELAKVMETTPEEIELLKNQRGRKLSIDAPIGSDADAGTLLDVMPDQDAVNPDATLLRNSLSTEIKNALSTLSEKEAQVLSLYYGLSGGHAISLEEIGAQFELTRERVRQIKEKATRKLRNSSRTKMLKTYLG